MLLYDIIIFLKYLLKRCKIDSDKEATVGMSIVGLRSWWITVLNTEIKNCVDIVAQVLLEQLILENQLNKHGFYYFMPGFLKNTSTLSIQSQIVPRARMSLVGNHDVLCPLVGVNLLNQ